MYFFWTIIMCIVIGIFFGTCKAVDDHPEQLRKIMHRAYLWARAAYSRLLVWSMEQFNWLPEEQMTYIDKITATDLDHEPPCERLAIAKSVLDPNAISVGIERRHRSFGEHRRVPSVKQFMKEVRRHLNGRGWRIYPSATGDIVALPPHYDT